MAARLGYRHIDTGAMYRAVAWSGTCGEGVDLADEDAVAEAARRACASRSVTASSRVDGQDVAAAIRTPEIDAAAAAVSVSRGSARCSSPSSGEMGGTAAS